MSSSSSSDNRSESSLSLPDDAIESAGSVTSLSSGASDAKAISSRVPRHDGDASASEALLALREPRTHPTKALDSEDRRASWQRLPSVALVPRFRRQLGDAYSADDDASTDAHMKDPSVAATSSSDEDEEMPYVGGDVTVSTSAGSKTPVTSGAIPPASLRTKRRPSTKNSRADSGYLEKGAVSPKFRRKLEWHHEAPALTSPSASPDSRTDALPAFVRASTSSLPPDDAAAEEGQGTMTSSQGKRHRHVPDSMQHIACYFCRRRKIKCGPPAGSDKSCPPCAKRQLPCEYAEKSNRGMRTDLIRKKESLAALSTSGSSLGDVSTGGSTSGSVSAS